MQGRLGFVSFGHYQDVPRSRTRTAAVDMRYENPPLMAELAEHVAPALGWHSKPMVSAAHS